MYRRLLLLTLAVQGYASLQNITCFGDIDESMQSRLSVCLKPSVDLQDLRETLKERCIKIASLFSDMGCGHAERFYMEYIEEDGDDITEGYFLVDGEMSLAQIKIFEPKGGLPGHVKEILEELKDNQSFCGKALSFVLWMQFGRVERGCFGENGYDDLAISDDAPSLSVSDFLSVFQ